MKVKRIPLHEQITDLMRQKIKQKEWCIGDRLPSSTELAAKYKIAINTVRVAINKLEKEKYIIRLTDKQLYIADPKPKHHLDLFSYFTETILSQTKGKNSWCKIITKQTYRAGDTYSKKFNINVEELILYVKKVLYVDKTPIALEYVYIPKNRIPKIDGIDLSIFSFNEIYTLYGIHTAEIRQSLSVIQLEKKDAKLLNLEENCISMFLKSSTYDDDNCLIELKKIYVNVAEISFNVNFSFA